MKEEHDKDDNLEDMKKKIENSDVSDPKKHKKMARDTLRILNGIKKVKQMERLGLDIFLVFQLSLI